MKKTKAILIAHASHSYFLAGDGKDELRNLILSDWYSRTARQLKRFDSEIEIECWAPEKLNKKEEMFTDSGIKYRIFPTTISPVYALDFSIPMINALKEELKISKESGTKTVIHLHEYHNLHGLLIATLFKGQKIIAQHHGGSWPLKHLRETKKYRIFFPFFLLGQIWENLVLKNINIFYALSEDEIIYLKEKAKNSEIRFQTMGIEEEYFKKVDKKIARKKLNIPLNKKMILYLGRINIVKGVKELIDSMREMKDIELKIIGFGPQETEYKNYVKENKIENVEFMGAIFGEKKMLYLSAADALVLPSSKEGAPVCIMEAMARNLPVIASKVGGTPLMIKDGENGLIIKPKNSADIVTAVKKILKNPPKNIRESARVYGWKDIIKNTVDDYNQKHDAPPRF